MADDDLDAADDTFAEGDGADVLEDGFGIEAADEDEDEDDVEDDDLVVATPDEADTFEDADDFEDDEDDEDVEDALDELLVDDEDELDELLEEDDEVIPLDEEDGARDKGRRTKVEVIGAGEFTCRSCFLVRRRSALADEERMLCIDCV